MSAGSPLMAFLASRQGGTAGDTAHPIDPLAQAMELRARYRAVYGSHDGITGILVKEKRGVPRYNHDPVMILWRDLDMDDEQDYDLAIRFARRHEALERLDCVVAYLSDCGKTLVAAPHTRKLLEPYPEPEA